MTNKIRTRRPKQKLLLDWAEERSFAVTVNVRRPAEPRFLKSSTIAIHLGRPGVKPRPASEQVTN